MERRLYKLVKTMKAKEYITKDEAISIIESVISADYDWQSAINNSVKNIKAIKSADVTKVVKCENCKWSKTSEYLFFSCLDCMNPRGLDATVAPNDFCSYGEEEE